MCTGAFAGKISPKSCSQGTNHARVHFADDKNSWLVQAFVYALGGIAAYASETAKTDNVKGDYLESRTCDVYTGPCFANGQIGLAGREAILAWGIDQGTYRGVDLAGLKVVMAIRAADTLGFGGGLVIHPDPIRSVIIVDQQATEPQREALAEFARERAGRLAGDVTRIDAAPIEMVVDHAEMVGRLKAGETAEIGKLLASLSAVIAIARTKSSFLSSVDGGREFRARLYRGRWLSRPGTGRQMGGPANAQARFWRPLGTSPSMSSRQMMIYSGVFLRPSCPRGSPGA